MLKITAYIKALVAVHNHKFNGPSPAMGNLHFGETFTSGVFNQGSSKDKERGHMFVLGVLVFNKVYT